MVRKEPSPRAGKVLVTFRLPSSLWASHIHLVGDFNGWNRTADPLMQRARDGAWVITVELDAGEMYEFRYLIDDKEWCNDDHADTYVTHRRDSDTSVVVASIPDEIMENQRDDR